LPVSTRQIPFVTLRSGLQRARRQAVSWLTQPGMRESRYLGVAKSQGADGPWVRPMPTRILQGQASNLAAYRQESKR
jgi:hypothetical protein